MGLLNKCGYLNLIPIVRSTLNFYNLKQTIKSGIRCYTYSSERGEGFQLIFDPAKQALLKIRISKGDTLRMIFQNSYVQTRNQTSLYVCSFLENENKTDVELLHLFSPEYGLLATRSTTWNAGSYLLLNSAHPDQLSYQTFLYQILYINREQRKTAKSNVERASR